MTEKGTNEMLLQAGGLRFYLESDGNIEIQNLNRTRTLWIDVETLEDVIEEYNKTGGRR